MTYRYVLQHNLTPKLQQLCTTRVRTHTYILFVHADWKRGHTIESAAASAPVSVCPQHNIIAPFYALSKSSVAQKGSTRVLMATTQTPAMNGGVSLPRSVHYR